MIKVALENIDKNNTYFHFTRGCNIESIEKNGIFAVNGGENAVLNDVNNPAIYFSIGINGALKAIDVWIRWEYSRMLQGLTGNDVMEETYKKIYDDFKDRKYLMLDLVEGDDPKTSDFSFFDIDKKKETVMQNETMLQYLKWFYGSYSNLDSLNMEDWNMNTHIGKKNIKPNKIKQIEATNGRTDALSIIIEMYEKYKNPDIELTDLQGFMEYAIDRYKMDMNFSEREYEEEEKQRFLRMNKIGIDDCMGDTNSRISLMEYAIDFIKEERHKKLGKDNEGVELSNDE